MLATKLVPFVDVQAAITVARREGERLAADMQQLQRDVRARADATVKALEIRAARVVGVFERELSRVAEGLLRRLSAATHSEIEALGRRVAELEQQRTTTRRRRPAARTKTA